MRSLVFFRKGFEATQNLLPFLGWIFGLHHQSETVEFALVSGPYSFREYLSQAGGQRRSKTCLR